MPSNQETEREGKARQRTRHLQGPDQEQAFKVCSDLVELISSRVGESRPGRAYREKVNRLLRRILAVTRRYGALELSEFQGSLLVNDRMLGLEIQRRDLVQGMILVMLRNNLRGIRIGPEVKADELDLLCFWLAHGAADPARPQATPNLYLGFNEEVELPEEEPAFERAGARTGEDGPSTPPPGFLGEPITSSYRYDKVLFEEQARLTGRHKVSLFVHVGDIRLDGAAVRIKTDIKGTVQRETRNGQPAVFYLAPGHYEAEVTYDKFTVKKRFKLVSEDLELEVDLQAYEDYQT